MNRKIYIQGSGQNQKVAITEDGRLVEYVPLAGHVAGDSAGDSTDHFSARAGDIVLGQVVDIVPGLDAAFVNIGQRQHAFLGADDLQHWYRTSCRNHLNNATGPAHQSPLVPETASVQETTPTQQTRPVQEIVSVEQPVLVQIKKEASGSKGAKVSTDITLTGTYIVYLPYGHEAVVANRIDGEQQRQRLHNLGEQWRQDGEGFIFRTSAQQAEEQMIHAELEQLRTEWQHICQQVELEGIIPPQVISYTHPVRQLLNLYVHDDTTLYVFDDEQEYEQARSFIATFAPACLERIIQHDGQAEMLDATIRKQIEQVLHKKVWLPGGSFLVVEQTATLTLIDVNTGRYTKGSHYEEMAFYVNREAISEIVRQIRLRNIGGIILIDFVSMAQEKNLHAIVNELKLWAAKDRHGLQVRGITSLGLVEMTRPKKTRSLLECLTDNCPHCSGNGRISRAGL